MIDAAATYRHAVVIGGGLLGLEAANGLMLRGMEVTVVHIAPWLMERQLDRRRRRHAAQVAGGPRADVPARGADRRSCVGDDGRAAACKRRCASRTAARSPADLVVMAVGIRPNTALAESAGLHCQRAASSSTTRCRPSPTRASTRSANARRTAASPTAWSRRCSSRPRSARRTWRSSASAATLGSLTLDQAQGHRHRPVLRRRLHGRRAAARRSCCPTRTAASTRSS